MKPVSRFPVLDHEAYRASLVRLGWKEMKPNVWAYGTIVVKVIRGDEAINYPYSDIDKLTTEVQ